MTDNPQPADNLTNLLKRLRVWQGRRESAHLFRQCMSIYGVSLNHLSNKQLIGSIGEGTFIREVERLLGIEMGDPLSEVFQQQAEKFYGEWVWDGSESTADE